MTLSEGELAVALDTGNLYIGTTSGNQWINPPAEAAEYATRLETARAFSVTGDATAPAVNFDGTGNVTLNLSLATISGLKAGTYTKVTVDEKGRVTGATAITVSDLPSIPNTKITGLGTASTKNTGTSAGNVVTVGSDGKIAESLIPLLAISDTFEAENESAMLALTAQKGDICIRSDEGKTYILTASPASTLENWKWLKTPDCKIISVNGKTGAVTLSASDVGAEPKLSNATAKTTLVDNDEAIIRDSAASGATKKITFANLKAVLKTYFDTLYNKYVHPTYTARSSGLYKVTVDGTGHVSAATAVGKSDITALGIPAQDTTYSDMKAATASAAGTHGLVPAPAAGNQSKFLRGDGTWQTPANTTYADMKGATSSAAGTHGLVPAPAAGKQASFLRGDGTWAVPTDTKYTLPTASASVLGGVKIGTGLTIASGVVSVGDIDGGTF